MEVDRRLEVLDVAEAAGHALDRLDLAVEPLAHRVGDRMLVVGQDVVDVPADRLRRLRIGSSRQCVAQKYQRFQNVQPDAG